MLPDRILSLLLEKLANGIYLLYKKSYEPERLSGNTLAIFKQFKSAYDSKNINSFKSLISNNYTGNFGYNKAELLILMDQFFQSFPPLLNPNLTIYIFQIIEDSNSIFKAVIQFKTHLSFTIVPIRSLELGEAYIEITPEIPYGIWKISKIEILEHQLK
ncbi:MAG: hypothetical protein ACKPEN_20960 [Planktothrix sp.]|uniref:hypothetical protein n=1 Tax=Planktothrix sp. TaxID=3088171 RepID=UPI0038D4F781